MAERKMSDFDKLTKIARNNILTSDDPEKAEDGTNGNTTELWHVANDVRRLIQGCYEFGLNPLPHLRHYFPAFDWTYWGMHDGKNHDPTIHGFDRGFSAHVTAYDYTWVSDENGEWANGVVSARERNRSTPRKIFFNSDTGVMPKPREEFIAAGIKIIEIDD